MAVAVNNPGLCKSEHAENAMVRAGTQQLFMALARHHYTRSVCEDGKDYWAKLAGIKRKRPTGPKPMSAEKVKAAKRAVRLIANNYGYSAKQLFGEGRDKQLVAVRQRCFYHLRKGGMSYSDIGRIMSRDHSTVMHGIAKFRETLA